MGNEWVEARHRKRRSPMDTGGRPIDPATGRPVPSLVTRLWESIVKPKQEPKGKHEQ